MDDLPVPLFEADLTVYGYSDVIGPTRVPRSLFGRLEVGSVVRVRDREGLFRVAELSGDGGRDVTLVAV